MGVCKEEKIGNKNRSVYKEEKIGFSLRNYCFLLTHEYITKLENGSSPLNPCMIENTV